MSDPASIWLDAPCMAAAVWLEDGRAAWRLNRAAIEASLDRQLHETDWQAALAAWLQARVDGPAPLRVGGHGFRCQVVDLPPGWLLWLQADAAPARAAEAHAAEDKLALMQGFGRVGFVERDVRSGRGWWDPQMFRMAGLEPALQPPGFDAALQRVHPDDREALRRHHLQALQQAGQYQTRYRLLQPDGRYRDVQALAEVRNGADGRPATLLGVVIDDTESADRVRAQQAINAQLARAMQLAMIAVWRVDLQQRRVHVTDNGIGLAGMDTGANTVPLEQTRLHVHPADALAVERAAARALAEDTVVDLESRYLHADGSYRHLLTRRVAERDAQGRAVALTGVALDQTERITERERAQALARRMQQVADAAGIGIWSIENPGQGAAERVEWNAQMFRIYGLPEQGSAPPVHEWMGDRVHVQDRDRVADERQRARHSGRDGFETSFRVVQPDGSTRWVVCRSHRERRDGRTRLHGIHIDVTDQQQLAQALQLQQQRLRLATQFAGVGIWDRDLLSDRVVWDDQMFRLRGLQPDDPRSPREIDDQLVAPQDLAERRRRIQRHLQDAEDYAYEFRVRWPDGSERWLASTGHAVRDDSGQAVRMVGLNWDVTQRRRAEAARREAEAAERASRAKSEFLARMSHELRTPLNAMLGFAQLLELEGVERLDAQQRERLAHIRSAGTHLLSLIDEVLDLSAVEAGSMPVALQPIGLDEALQDVQRWVAPMAEARALRLRFVNTGATVLADARRLRQVLTNLLTNAVKYNRPGGHVTVDARRMVVDGVPGWELAVRDSGRGISAEQQAHLFEPFNRLGAEREGIEGRGIGLLTVHHLVRLMGGRLELHSQVGEGSVLRVWLPGAAAGAAAVPLP
ncbi:MAG: PAS domain-containing protein, partial [Burkholderiales bacterium]|nr:PAS domain-containing protein [Burkholderiales bacterium]